MSTGGTYRFLNEEHKLPVTEVSDYTGFPEMLDGRVKTLHPFIHAGILGRRSVDSDVLTMAEHGIKPIDLVVVDLYPFEEVTAKEDCTFEMAIENIDIGGVALARAAAKNHKDVAVVVDHRDYPKILTAVLDNDCEVGDLTRLALALVAFTHTSRYDKNISMYLLGHCENFQNNVQDILMARHQTDGN